MGLMDLFKAKPSRKPSDAPRSPNRTFSTSKLTVSYENAIAAELALQHPVVFRCLTKIASSVQTVRWFCEPDPMVLASDRAPSNVIKGINKLLASPNDSLAPDQLKYWMALNYAVYGRCGFKVGMSAIDTKMPSGIYPLDSKYLKAIPNDRGTTAKYEYGNGEDKQEYITRTEADATGKGQSYVHEMFTPNLSGTQTSAGQARNINPLGAIGIPSQVVRLLLERAVDTATGHFNSKYIVTGEKTITEKQKESLREHIEDGAAGGEESGKILFLGNTTIKIDKLDNDLSDIHSKIPLDDMTRIIAGAFGIPIALMGIGGADGAKFAGNYSESRATFWSDTIIPSYLVPIASGLTTALCPPGARISFDLDTIDALADGRIIRAKNLTTVNFLTTDEKRELCGYEPTTLIPQVIVTKPDPASADDQKGNTEDV